MIDMKKLDADWNRGVRPAIYIVFNTKQEVAAWLHMAVDAQLKTNSVQAIMVPYVTNKLKLELESLEQAGLINIGETTSYGKKSTKKLTTFRPTAQWCAENNVAHIKADR